MIEVFNRIRGIIAIMIVASIANFVVYDLRKFQPVLPEIERAINTSLPSIQAMSSDLQALLACEFRSKSDHYSAGLAIEQFDVYPKGSGPGFGWQFTNATWTLLMKMHFSPEKRIAYIGDRLHVEGHRGLDSISYNKFGRPINRISREELATLLVLLRAPGFFRDRESLLIESRNRLLEKCGP